MQLAQNGGDCDSIVMQLAQIDGSLHAQALLLAQLDFPAPARDLPENPAVKLC